MTTANVYNIEGKKIDTLELAEQVFGIRPNDHVMYEYVKMQLANRRAGTRKAKTRGEVSGTTAKPWRQKGTGRARSGSSKSPVWVHGGVAFPPKPKIYNLKMNKKVKKLAIRSALSSMLREEKIFILDKMEIAQPKTKIIAGMLSNMGLDKAVIIDDGMTEAARKSIRNVRDTKYLDLMGLNVFDILKYKNIVMTKKAVAKVEELYS
jgi:large subunit ribosomal protein L4